MRTLKYTAFVTSVALVLMTAPAASAAPPRLWGVYDIGSQQGIVEFTVARLVRPGYYIGYFVVDGQEYLGYYYRRPGTDQISLGWKYDRYPDYPLAGSMAVTYYPDPELAFYFGDIAFYDDAESLIGSGWVVLIDQ